MKWDSVIKRAGFFLALQVLWLTCINVVSAAEQVHKTDIKTLVIVSHPYPERSVM